jgi:sterol desaturase/sphingolipid hydroxylase (fatty acid hydroxylase superfamily)
LGLIILSVTFIVCTFSGLLDRNQKELSLNRTNEEWMLDLVGLIVQGALIPTIPFIVLPLLKHLLPEFLGFIQIHPLIQFILSFIGLDYLYYWNHRLIHTRGLWYLHRLHHSSNHLDVLATSRNTFLTSFLYVYLWAQIIGLYLIQDSEPFMFGLSLTFALDIWRHSGIKTPATFRKTLGRILILPENHVLHHSTFGRAKNFGGNLNLWDRLHCTYSPTIIKNSNIEERKQTNLLREFIFPARLNR